MAEGVESQPTQDEPNPSIIPSSIPLVTSKPSTSGSQKFEVTKKKRKTKDTLEAINECVDEQNISEELESTLASLVPRRKKQVIGTGSHSASSQKDVDVIIGAHLLVEILSLTCGLADGY